MQTHAAQPHTHHPIGVYLRVWGLLFVLSAMSYFVDYFEVQPVSLRWLLIVGFAVVKSALILNYFMHLRWERLSLVYTILLPPLLVLALVAIVMAEGAYVLEVRRLLLGG